MAEHFPDATKKVDCISRAAALDFLIPANDLNISAKDKRVIADRFAEFIKSIPAADVRPVVRGKWEIDNSYAGPGLMNLRCSVCGEFGGTWKDNTLPSMLYKFCPNCGADMRPDKNDQRGEQQGRENRKTLR